MIYTWMVFLNTTRVVHISKTRLAEFAAKINYVVKKYQWNWWECYTTDISDPKLIG